MLRRVSGVKDHYAEERHHVGQPVERRIEKASELRHISCHSSDIAVEHVENVRYDQYDTGPKEFAEPEQNAAPDIYRNADCCQDVRMDTNRSQAANHRVDDGHGTASYAFT